MNRELFGSSKSTIHKNRIFVYLWEMFSKHTCNSIIFQMPANHLRVKHIMRSSCLFRIVLLLLLLLLLLCCYAVVSVHWSYCTSTDQQTANEPIITVITEQGNNFRTWKMALFLCLYPSVWLPAFKRLNIFRQLCTEENAKNLN